MLISGWSSPADTLQWARWRVKEQMSSSFSDLNSSAPFFSQKREVNTILADIIKHMTPDRAFEDAYPQVTSSSAHTYVHLKRNLVVLTLSLDLQLQSAIRKILEYFHNFSVLFSMVSPSLLPIIRCFLFKGWFPKQSSVSFDLSYFCS